MTTSKTGKITKLFFISTGRKNAFYTLRTKVISDGFSGHAAAMMVYDNHVCTLAATEEKALEKARAYVNAFRDRVGESASYKIEFAGIWSDEVIKRRGKLSVWETLAINEIEVGRFPFGKHKGEEIANASPNYILYFVDQANKPDLSAAMVAS